MTKKHYISIAKAIRETKEEMAFDGHNADSEVFVAINKLAHKLAQGFVYENSAFDSARFEADCEVKP